MGRRLITWLWLGCLVGLAAGCGGPRETISAEIETYAPTYARLIVTPPTPTVTVTLTLATPTLTVAAPTHPHPTPPTPTAHPPSSSAPSPTPTLISPPITLRSTWCLNTACTYTRGLHYAPVTHFIIHHTASSNRIHHWPELLRSIWHDHTTNRGWEDIAYNYLIDPEGRIYEGHLGGDNVVGHMTGGPNGGEGVMSVALLGTFTDSAPPPAMIEALIALLTWKSQVYQIDPLAAGPLPGLTWDTPTISGHADVYGTTLCPGRETLRLLPAIRQQITANLSRLTLVTPPERRAGPIGRP